MVSWNITAVVGVPGVGKTSLCRQVAEEIGCNYINYGDLMLEIAVDQNLAHSDQEMFALDMDVQYHIWEEAAHKIRDQDHMLVDLHGLDQSPEGYLISLPLEIISPSCIVIVESSLENIMFRRKKDVYKERIKDDFRSLSDHMQMLRTSMIVCSVFLGSTVYILNNENLKQSKIEMVNLLNK
jgi:adenylate kinase